MSADRHNHVTRDVKPRGQCPACDRILDKAAETLPVAPSRRRG